MRVLIAGCGYVGTTLGLHLVAAGHEVLGLRRDPSGLPDAIRPVAGDLVTGEGLEALPPDLDACVSAVSAQGRDEDAYRAAYVDATRTLRTRVEGRIPRWVFVSSTAVHGDTGGDWVDETTPPRPDSFRGRLVLEGEAIVRGTDTTGIVLRLGGIYGPGRTRLLDAVRDGTARIPAEPRWSNRIHRDDAAGALAHLLTLPDPQQVYLGVDHEPVERGVLLRWLAERLGVPAPPVDARAASTRGDKRARNDRLVRSGYVFRYPTFRDGYDQLLRDGYDQQLRDGS